MATPKELGIVPPSSSSDMRWPKKLKKEEGGFDFIF
jgi:hypothetical protein